MKTSEAILTRTAFRKTQGIRGFPSVHRPDVYVVKVLGYWVPFAVYDETAGVWYRWVNVGMTRDPIHADRAVNYMRMLRKLLPDAVELSAGMMEQVSEFGSVGIL